MFLDRKLYFDENVKEIFDKTSTSISLICKLRVYSVNLPIQSGYSKIQTRNNSVFGLFSRSVSSSGELSGNLISLLRIIEFGLNTEYSKSSSIYITGQLFRLTSTSNNASCNSC